MADRNDVTGAERNKMADEHTDETHESHKLNETGKADGTGKSGNQPRQSHKTFHGLEPLPVPKSFPGIPSLKDGSISKATVITAVVALLIGALVGYGMRNPVDSSEYKAISGQLADAQNSLTTTKDQLDTTKDKLKDEQTHSEELEEDNDTLNSQVTSLTTERDKLNETIKQLTPNVNPGSNPIEILDIKDMGAEYGFRELEFTVKSNVAAILTSVSIQFQIVDGNGNISRSDSAGAYSVVLNPGKTTVATTFTEDRGYGKGSKIVPVKWTYRVQNGSYTDGDYGEGVKTGEIK